MMQATGKVLGFVVVGILALLAACAPAAPASTPSPAGKATVAPSTGATPAASAPQAPAKAGELERLIEGARKEGLVKANMIGSLTPKAGQRMIDAFNKKYGLNLKLEQTPSVDMAKMAAQVLTEVKSGTTPSWDLFSATPRSFVRLVDEGLLVTYNWRDAFPYVPQEAILFKGAALSYSSYYFQPAYNPNLVKPADVPKKWEDLLDPKWKGKIVVYGTADPWIKLAEAKGEEWTTKQVEGLTKQDPIYLPSQQLIQKVVSGEYPLGSHAVSSSVFDAQAKDQPIRLAEEVEPMVGDVFAHAIPKGAEHANAATLFLGFTLSPEGQQIFWEETRLGYALTSKPMLDMLKGKKIIYATTDFALGQGPRLEDKYLKIEGLK